MHSDYSVLDGNDDLIASMHIGRQLNSTSQLLYDSNHGDAYNFANTTVAGAFPANTTAPMVGLQMLEHNVQLAIEFYIKPIIYIIGIPGNVVSLILWLQPRLRNSSGCYFAALSLSDTVVLALHLLCTLEKGGLTRLLETPLSCEVFNVLFIWAECLSLMLVLGLTVDRFIIVCHPMQCHRLCTLSRTLRILALLAAISLVLGVVEGFFWTYSRPHGHCESIGVRVGRNLLMKVGNVAILVVGVAVPVVLVIALNGIIIATVHRTNRRRRALCHLPSSSSAAAGGGTSVGIETDATIMLLSVSCYMILAEVPDQVAYLVKPFYPEGTSDTPTVHHDLDATWRRHYTFGIASCFLSAFSLTNYAVGIFIYSFTGHKFRQMACVVLRCRICDEEGRRAFRRTDSVTSGSRVACFPVPRGGARDGTHAALRYNSAYTGEHHSLSDRKDDVTLPEVAETFV